MTNPTSVVFDTRIDPKQRLALQQHFRRPQLRTPFHPRIKAEMRGGHWYDWAGYDSPVFIEDDELEYFAIRSTAALFDITPMIKYRVEGPDAESYFNRLTLRDVSRHPPGKVRYTAWCDDDGYVLDDGTLFRFSENRFRLCCQERHLPWLIDSGLGYDIEIVEETDNVAALALQGPTSAAILNDAGFTGVSRLKPFDIAEFPHESGTVTISRTGFTGDLGYELWIENDLAVSLWDRLWSAGRMRGLRVIGYNALNQARIEAGFIVAQGDFITSDAALRPDRLRRPDEIGLDWMVDLGKSHFNGRRAIAAARENNANRYVLVGLDIEGKEPAEHAIVYHYKTREVGLVSAAIWSPTAKRNIAIASLRRPWGIERRDDLWVEIYAYRELQYHKLMMRARIVDRPFIRLPRRTQTPPDDF